MIYVLLLLLSFLATYVMRWYSLKKGILDIPNDRSSHTIPTPRGGGVAIIMVFYIGLFYFYKSLDTHLFYTLLTAIPIALIGILDDIYTISSKIRFLVQSIATISALYCLGGVNHIDFIGVELSGVWLNIIAFITILWLTNLYNFLDGIDGYAGMEAVTIGIGIYVLFGNPMGLVISMASLGFLYFNWHKASIFMGDVGSATLGFIFAVFLFSDTTQENIYIWMVLLSIFWIDATVTLIRRAKNKEKLTQAHKKHAYQRLAQSGYSPSRITMYAGSINMVFIIFLYYWNHPLIILGINMLLLSLILNFVERKKHFKR